MTGPSTTGLPPNNPVSYVKTKPGAAAGIGSASTANKRPRESSPSGGPGGSSAFAQLKKFRESLEKSHEKGTLLKEAGGGGATASAAANMPKSHQQSQQIRPHAQTNPRASLSQQLQKSSASKPNNPSTKPKQPQTGMGGASLLKKATAHPSTSAGPMAGASSQARPKPKPPQPKPKPKQPEVVDLDDDDIICLSD